MRPALSPEVLEERKAAFEAQRTDPDYWVRKAEAAVMRYGSPENVSAYLAIARYHRDGQEAS